MSKKSVKARVIKASPPTESTKQIYEDEFADSYDSNILPPPYNLKELKMIAEYSTILQHVLMPTGQILWALDLISSILLM